MLTETLSVEAQALRAYTDCWRMDATFEVTSRLRDLNFRASEPVARDEAVRIMASALRGMGAYNNFTPELLAELPECSRIILARENSVCVYVEGYPPKSLARRMKADEWMPDYNVPGFTRIWWD